MIIGMPRARIVLLRMQQVTTGSYTMPWIPLIVLLQARISFSGKCVWTGYYTRKMAGPILQAALRRTRPRMGRWWYCRNSRLLQPGLDAAYQFAGLIRWSWCIRFIHFHNVA